MGISFGAVCNGDTLAVQWINMKMKSAPRPAPLHFAGTLHTVDGVLDQHGRQITAPVFDAVDAPANMVPSGMWLEFGGAVSGNMRYRFRLQGQSADQWALWQASANHRPCAGRTRPEASSAQNNIAAVSADGKHSLRLDPSFELLVQPLDRIRSASDATSDSRLNTPGDYATLISNQLRDGTANIVRVDNSMSEKEIKMAEESEAIPVCALASFRLFKCCSCLFERDKSLTTKLMGQSLYALFEDPTPKTKRRERCGTMNVKRLPSVSNTVPRTKRIPHSQGCSSSANGRRPN